MNSTERFLLQLEELRKRIFTANYQPKDNFSELLIFHFSFWTIFFPSWLSINPVRLKNVELSLISKKENILS